MHKSKGRTEARKVYTSTLVEVKYTDTKKGDLNLFVNAAIQEAF